MRYTLVLLCALAGFGTTPASATTVNVSVKTNAGEPVEDTIVIFDPLDGTPPATQGTAVIDQVDRTFVPKVSVLRTGTSVSFPNSDRIRHQVYSFSKPKIFSLKLYAGSPHVDVVFDKPGLVVLGCNIHDTMIAFVGVVDSPYFTKIPRSGAAAVNLPAGRYRLRVWHPALSSTAAPAPVVVGNEVLQIPLVIDIDPARDTVASWPE